MSNLEVKRDAVSFVDYKIRQRKVMLFSKKFSAECKMVKHILETYKMAPNSYEVCEIECRQDCTQIENYFLIICLTNSREVSCEFVFLVFDETNMISNVSVMLYFYLSMVGSAAIYWRQIRRRL